jgi:malonyl CoA-acyl carrier protein transacylase
MRIASLVIPTLLLACLASLHAQQAGMQNEWDIHKTLTAIAVHADRVVPFVDQIHPEQWVSSGAPDAYIKQAKTCRDELKGVAAAARALSQNPEKLTDTLQLLFRIRTLEMMLASLGEGLRKYQNPPMADMLNTAVAENNGNREHLQQYVLELATAREQECRVADQEAQRCRQSLSRQPSRDRTAPRQEKH